MEASPRISSIRTFTLCPLWARAMSLASLYTLQAVAEVMGMVCTTGETPGTLIIAKAQRGDKVVAEFSPGSPDWLVRACLPCEHASRGLSLLDAFGSDAADYFAVVVEQTLQAALDLLALRQGPPAGPEVQ